MVCGETGWHDFGCGSCLRRLVEIEKGYAGRRGRTWITLTAAGEAALAEEIARLKQLIARVDTTIGR